MTQKEIGMLHRVVQKLEDLVDDNARQHENIQKATKSLAEQVALTNGRVKKLELWKAYLIGLVGGIGGILSILLTILTFFK